MENIMDGVESIDVRGETDERELSGTTAHPEEGIDLSTELTSPNAQPHQQSEDGNEVHCIVCADPIDQVERLTVVGTCGHKEMCSHCALRLRKFHGDKRCPYCNVESDVVVAVPSTEVQWDEVQFGAASSFGHGVIDDDDDARAADTHHANWHGIELHRYDQSGVFMTTAYREEVNKLLGFRCGELVPSPQGGILAPCEASFSNNKQLSKHLRESHGLQFCRLCLAHKPAFPSEQQRFPVSGKDLELHMIKGNPKEGFPGHPRCSWCKQRFYANEQLTKHYTENHFACHICERQGIKNNWFKDYQSLDVHFSTRHFPCHDPQCKSRRFVAFEDEFQLQAHIASTHPSSLRNGTIKFNYQHRKPAGGGNSDSLAREGTAEQQQQQQIDAEILQSEEAFPTLTGEQAEQRRQAARQRESKGAAATSEPVSNTPFGAWCSRSDSVKKQKEDFPTLGAAVGKKDRRNANKGAWADPQKKKKATATPQPPMPPPQQQQQQYSYAPQAPRPQQPPRPEDFPSLGGPPAASTPPPSWGAKGSKGLQTVKKGGKIKQQQPKKPAAAGPPAEPTYCASCGLRANNLKGGLCGECVRNKWPSMPKSGASSRPHKSQQPKSTAIHSTVSRITANSGQKKKKKPSTGISIVRNSAITGQKN